MYKYIMQPNSHINYEDNMEYAEWSGTLKLVYLQIGEKNG